MDGDFVGDVVGAVVAPVIPVEMLIRMEETHTVVRVLTECAPENARERLALMARRARSIRTGRWMRTEPRSFPDAE